MEKTQDRKYYLHPTANIEDGKITCVFCGAELPQSLKTDFPCTVSAKAPFDEKVSVYVWDCMANVYFDNINIKQFCTEQELEKLDRYAIESVYDAGGAINFSGQYPPSDKLVRYVMRLAKKYTAQLLTVKLQRAQEKIQKLQKEVEEEEDDKLRIKKAAMRYVARTPRDQAFLQALKDRNLFYLIHSKDAEQTIMAMKSEFPEYYQTKDQPRQDFTDDANLLQAGYVVCEVEHSLPCF